MKQVKKSVMSAAVGMKDEMKRSIQLSHWHVTSHQLSS